MPIQCVIVSQKIAPLDAAAHMDHALPALKIVFTITLIIIPTPLLNTIYLHIHIQIQLM